MFNLSTLFYLYDIQHRSTVDCRPWTEIAEFAVSFAINCKIFTSGKDSLFEKLVAGQFNIAL